MSFQATDGGTYSLDELLAEDTLLLFAHAECPTSRLALQRIGPLGPELARAGTRLVCVVQEPLETAARLARQHAVDALVVAERSPFELAARFDVETVPTFVLGEERIVGWSADALDELLPVRVPGDEPRFKPGCEARPLHDAHTPPSGREKFDELEEMFERGWTDGLPVIPPTPERVDAMLAGRDPNVALGQVPPALGEATLARVASCAVLAGCKPAYFPVVLAAVEAMLEPEFNLHGQAVTTSPPGQIVVVNGPVREQLGIESGMGALGPGNRANLTIGRAVRLVAQLTGGGFPGRLDRATLGHPGKIAFCFAEDEETSPWEPLHVERGFAADASTVTLVAGDSPLSVSDHRSKTPEGLAECIGWAAATTWSPFWWPMDATSLVILGQEHVRLFAAAGWTKADVRRSIFEQVRRPARELRRGETTPLVWNAADDEQITKWDDPGRIVIVVAGGEAGRFSAVCGPALGMGAALITKEVRWNT